MSFLDVLLEIYMFLKLTHLFPKSKWKDITPGLLLIYFPYKILG